MGRQFQLARYWLAKEFNQRLEASLEASRQELVDGLEDLEGLISAMWSAVLVPLVERVESLESALRIHPEFADLPNSISELRKLAISRAIAKAGGKKELAARLLGVTIKTLYNWQREQRGK